MYDFIIIGGGIVGVSTALSLTIKHPDKKILLLEKERAFATHQTGHNSGVIHAGVYYQPGSLKAQFCKEGLKATVEFCIKHDIPFEQCGKLLVATTNDELGRMNTLFERCQQNEIEVELLNKGQLKQIEPNITGLGAILVKSSGIVNYQSITKKMVEQFEGLGGEYLLDTQITSLSEDSESVAVITKQETFKTKYLISCAGLMADRIVKMLNIPIDFQIIPFRGEYFQLPEKCNQLVSHLIYPVPDPELPFLGIHLTKMIDGSITVGPNAVLGFKREGYSRINFSAKDVVQMLFFKGFYRVIRQNLKSGIGEMLNSIYRGGYLKQVQKYCPSINHKDLQPYPAGIRAQAVLQDGSLVHDFLFAESKRSIHVCNAPSPAATSAMPIGNYITKKAIEAFNQLS
ncbi:MAG: L-2-hydroxyglutarate oxidase [Gammaproteobacteria bacterium]|nr:L-2-hydroxyglutarate oxidase [Gammaproteobacteria bacterium]